MILHLSNSPQNSISSHRFLHFLPLHHRLKGHFHQNDSSSASGPEPETRFTLDPVHTLCVCIRCYSVWFQFFPTLYVLSSQLLRASYFLTFFLSSLLPGHQLHSLHLCSLILSCTPSLTPLPTLFRLPVFFLPGQILRRCSLPVLVLLLCNVRFDFCYFSGVFGFSSLPVIFIQSLELPPDSCPVSAPGSSFLTSHPL